MARSIYFKPVDHGCLTDVLPGHNQMLEAHFTSLDGYRQSPLSPVANSPSKLNSPSIIVRDNLSGLTFSSVAKIPTANGKSYPAPSLRISAGAILTTNCFEGGNGIRCFLLPPQYARGSLLPHCPASQPKKELDAPLKHSLQW